MAILKEQQHFVVLATHPDHPNFGPQMRGRKVHLATSHKKSSKTLCNMIVVEGVEPNTAQSDRETCRNCFEMATRVIDRRFNKTTYSFTINTDASHYPDHGGVTAWAAWIKSSHYLIKEAGLLPEGVAQNSAMAETLAVEQALLLLDKLIAEEPFLQDQKILIYFNTDSQFTVKALAGNIRRQAYRELIERVRGLASRYEIVPRHVKGHRRGKLEAREYVNNWCDEQARGLANKRWRELNEQAAKKV